MRYATILSKRSTIFLATSIYELKSSFEQYPNIKKKIYDLVQGLRDIFNTATSVQTAYTKLAHWYKDVEQIGFKAFNTMLI